MIIVDMIVRYFRNWLILTKESGIKEYTKTSIQNAAKALLNDFRFIIDGII